MRQLFRELKRRNVYKVAVTYGAVAFVTLQAARLIFPATTLEGLYDKLVVLAFVGFSIALVIAWAFELTPEGGSAHGRDRCRRRRLPSRFDVGEAAYPEPPGDEGAGGPGACSGRGGRRLVPDGRWRRAVHRRRRLRGRGL